MNGVVPTRHPQHLLLVSLQDITSRFSVGCSHPLPEIDRQLYDKYALPAPEREFIESMIKPMG